MALSPDNQFSEVFSASDRKPDYEASRYSVIDTDSEKHKLGTYLGVFRPTLLTILGVIMYIRMGWIVGHAGLLGAWLILALTFLITGCAALSFSSITTNIRLKAGGVFALVSQSLGLEAGGAIGLPLYLAQSLGAALYIYGFAEGWSFFFPDHDKRLVVLGIFLGGFSLSLISEKLILRLQLLVLLTVVFALVNMFGGWSVNAGVETIQLWGEFKEGSLWVLFAIFFPAGTGIKVGASLSGKLRNPRRSIPIGVLAAWGTALVVYSLLMGWYATVATPQELQGNYMIAVDRALWGPAVLIGLLSSCTSAMLSSMVAAPNVLAALGNHGILPFGKFLAYESRGGTPRNAALVNGLIVGLGLLLGDLNRVAVLITMFFLITYATINFVVLIEQSLGLVSFRPTFKVPIWVPMLGACASVFAMVIINPVFGLVAIGIVVAVYVYLQKRQLETPWETVRSGIFLALADWAARQSQKMDDSLERAWKPDLMVPIARLSQLQGDYRLLRALMKPKGSLQVLNVTEKPVDTVTPLLEEVIRDFQREGVFVTSATVNAPTIPDGVRMGTSVLRGSFFKPNILFVNTVGRSQTEIEELVGVAKDGRMGVALLMFHEDARLGRERDINIWIRDQSPDWTLGLRLANLDLAILLGYQIDRNWDGRMRLLSAIKDPSNVHSAEVYLRRLAQDARLPGRTDFWVEERSFGNALESAPRADLNIFGLGDTTPISRLGDFTAATRSSCLFVIDSGFESALA